MARVVRSLVALVAVFVVVVVVVVAPLGVSAQPPINGGPPGGGDGGGGDAAGVACPDDGAFVGDSTYTDAIDASAPLAAPLRGTIGCVTGDALARRPTVTLDTGDEGAATHVYGPFEAGFTSAQPGAACLGDATVAGGVDTLTAEWLMKKLCADGGTGEFGDVLDTCGGHALPYHYHERMSCLFDDDPTTGHSTRIGTALDGRGIYGHHVDGGVVPTDLDGCGGRFGVTPDSNGEVVYYYPIKKEAPFTLACFGPGTLDQCRALYAGCATDPTTIETEHGAAAYRLDCPCFNSFASNADAAGTADADASCRPAYLPAATADDNLVVPVAKLRLRVRTRTTKTPVAGAHYRCDMSAPNSPSPDSYTLAGEGTTNARGAATLRVSSVFDDVVYNCSATPPDDAAVAATIAARSSEKRNVAVTWDVVNDCHAQRVKVKVRLWFDEL